MFCRNDSNAANEAIRDPIPGAQLTLKGFETMSEEKKAARIMHLTPDSGMPATPEVVAKIEKLLDSGKAMQVSVDELPPELADLKAELQAKGIKEVVAIPHKRSEGDPMDVMSALNAADEDAPNFSKNLGLQDELVASLAELGVKPSQYVVRVRTKHTFTEDIASEFGRDVFTPQVADKLIAAGITTLDKLKENPPDKLRELGLSLGAVALVCRGMYAIMEEGAGQTAEQRQALRGKLMKARIEEVGGLDALFERLGLSPELIVAFERLAHVVGADVMDIVTGDTKGKVQAAIDRAIESGNSDLIEAVQDALGQLTTEQTRLREMMEGGSDSAPLADDPSIVQLLPDDFRNPEIVKIIGADVIDPLLEIGIDSIEKLMDDDNQEIVSKTMFTLDPKAERRDELQQKLQTARALSSRCGCSHCVGARAVYKASKFH